MAIEKEPENHFDGDELRQFVASTLKAVVAGLVDAKADSSGPSAHGSGDYAFGPPREVAFDIAVTARRSGVKGGGLKLEVFSVGANAKVDSSKENSTVSRISFVIPNHFKAHKK